MSQQPADGGKVNEERTTFLVNIRDGSRKLLNSGGIGISYSFSPAGNYLIYFDPSSKQYFSRNLYTDSTFSISSKIPTKLYDDDEKFSLQSIILPVGIAG